MQHQNCVYTLAIDSIKLPKIDHRLEINNNQIAN